MQFPIIIGLRRSRFMDGALAVLTSIALLAVAGVPWPVEIASLLAGALLFVTLHAARRLAPAFECLKIEADGNISGRLIGENEFLSLRLLPAAAVHPWLTVVRLAGERGTYRLLVAPDSAAPDEFRRLRICLRWRNDVSAADGDS